jgi:hypothetical protein
VLKEAVLNFVYEMISADPVERPKTHLLELAPKNQTCVSPKFKALQGRWMFTETLPPSSGLVCVGNILCVVSERPEDTTSAATDLDIVLNFVDLRRMVVSVVQTSQSREK